MCSEGFIAAWVHKRQDTEISMHRFSKHCQWTDCSHTLFPSPIWIGTMTEVTVYLMLPSIQFPQSQIAPTAAIYFLYWRKYTTTIQVTYMFIPMGQTVALTRYLRPGNRIAGENCFHFPIMTLSLNYGSCDRLSRINA